MMRFVLTGVACFSLTACGSSGTADDPTAELRAWVERGELAAESKDRGELLDMISTDYADSRGNDRDEIGTMLARYFFVQKNIALLTSIDDIQVYDGTAATIDLTVGMAGTQNTGIGLRADAYRFEFELEKADDTWMLIGMRYGELGGNLR
jgi:hypothetical protein